MEPNMCRGQGDTGCKLTKGQAHALVRITQLLVRSGCPTDDAIMKTLRMLDAIVE
jgi:hypothetical protein